MIELLIEKNSEYRLGSTRADKLSNESLITINPLYIHRDTLTNEQTYRNKDKVTTDKRAWHKNPDCTATKIRNHSKASVDNANQIRALL